MAETAVSAAVLKCGIVSEEGRSGRSDLGGDERLAEFNDGIGF